MLLNELNDQQVASAFIDQDPAQRRQDNAMTPQQLAKVKADQIAQDKVSTDPLARRIAAMRAQLAQLIIQKQNQDKQQANKPAGAQSPAPNGAVPKPVP